jgi:sulfhydrogenase subunit alpha
MKKGYVMSRGTPDRDLAVDGLARVEGDGSLHVVVRDGQVAEVSLSIFEPPRFFEALLVGRRHTEAPDITARICGICPVAYEMSACAAIEAACGIQIDPRVAALRRLLYCGEWIQSHALHIYLLHAPDFLGCQDAVELAERDKPAIERGLQLKRVGNLIMETVGGRAVHPVNVRVGGFYRAPDRSSIAGLRDPLLKALEAARATVDWVSDFDFPDTERPYLFVALRRNDCYAIEDGRIVSSAGLDTDADSFLRLVVEEQVARSTALHARLAGTQTYLTGPLARYAINHDLLPPQAREAANSAGLGPVCRNPFQSIIVRAVELVFACEESLRLVESYEPPDPSYSDVPPVEGTGSGATEAPRGLLLHRYELGADGIIQSARIVPPTSQNQLTIEDDLRQVTGTNLDLDDPHLTWVCEQAIRNHDPCISCAAHFLDLKREEK